jgi:hypothetical protein
MRRFIFAALLLVVAPPEAASLQVPGRDLLDFPIGNLAEGAGLATASGDGFRNPATAVLGVGERARFSVGAVSSSAVIGLSAQSLAVSAAILEDMTATVSVVRASVDGLFRTDSDPQSTGEISYQTFVVSGAVSRRENSYLSGGLALRYRTGTLDFERRSAMGIDGGVVLRGLPAVDGRFGISSFLWTLTGSPRERATLNTAADLRLLGRDSLLQARAGASWSYTTDYSDEKFLLLSGRVHELEGRGSLGRVTAFGGAVWRSRLALGLHYGRFKVAIAREESGGDLAASYQFALTAVLK